MTTDDFTEAARIIDKHRENERWVGDGVKIECACGHTSHATYDFSGPITGDKNSHRDAERMHAAHVAQVLAAQEPNDAEVEAAREAADDHFTVTEYYRDGEVRWQGCTTCNVEIRDYAEQERHELRAALSAARAARRDKEDDR